MLQAQIDNAYVNITPFVLLQLAMCKAKAKGLEAKWNDEIEHFSTCHIFNSWIFLR
jgi:hypothetical protein